MTSPPSSPDPVRTVSEVLSEVIDMVQDVKQAHRKVPENHALHAELDRLLEDSRRWAGRLIEEDEALGASILSNVATAAGRIPPNLWPGDASDEDVRRTLAEVLERLAGHLSSASQERGEEALFTEILQGVTDRLRALN